MAKSPGSTGLPPADAVRWTAQRKALVVKAVSTGVISFEEACHRYQLSQEELVAWHQAMETHGMGGLRVTRLQYYGNRAAASGDRPSDNGSPVDMIVSRSRQ